MTAWILLGALLALGAVMACSGSIPVLRVLFGAQDLNTRPIPNPDWDAFFDDYQH